MFRQLVGLTLLSLAVFGLSPAQANSEDNQANNDAYIYESAPIIELDTINNSGTTTRADVLQPTFTGSANRIFYDFEVEVTTTGELDNVDVIAACFFTSSAGDRDSLCGYSEENPKTAPADPNPSQALSMAWTTNDSFRIDGDNAHELGQSTHSTFSTNRTFNQTTDDEVTISYVGHRLKFQFALSHAAINTSDWTMRVVAVSTPTQEPGGPVPAPQRSEVLLTDVCAGDFVERIEDQSCSTPEQEFGVAFYGGFESSSRSVDYGQINENSSSVVKTGLSTGSYFANDEAILTVAASNFIFENGAETDTIPLQGDAVGEEQNKKELTLACTGDSGEILLTSSIQNLFVEEPLSSADGDPEAAKDAPTHQCQLHYGFGAVYANSTYQNVVSIGIRDNNEDVGPTADARTITPSLP